MMRPTFHEQIERTCQILESVILPAVSGDHPTEILRSLIGNLTMLNGALPLLEPFLEWDNDETRRLVVILGGEVSSANSTTEGATDSSESGANDVATKLTDVNRLLRQQLTDLLTGMSHDDPRMVAVCGHLVARSIRYPMRSTLPTPQAPVAEVK